MSGWSRRRPWLLRVWHALDGLVVLGLLGTVLLRKTVLSYRANGPLIEAKVAELGGTLSSEHATTVAKLLRDQMWEWHEMLGVALLALVVVRLVVIVVDRDQNPLATLSRAISRFGGVPASGRLAAMHPLLVTLTHTAFYGLLLVMAATGGLLLNADAIGLGEGLGDLVKEVHETLMWGVAAFVPLHILGVVAAELRGERGLASEMISGGPP